MRSLPAQVALLLLTFALVGLVVRLAGAGLDVALTSAQFAFAAVLVVLIARR